MSQNINLSAVRSALLWLGTLAILVGFNFAVHTKTQTLEHGAVVKLKLAPRDPRGLLTGDYMSLNYDIADQLRRTITNQTAQDGFVLVKLDAQGVGEFVSQSATYPVPGPQQLALQFRQRGSEIKLATNAYYFQEGKAKIYEAARYGEFRVSPKGELLLTHLLDEKLQSLK
jgi:uncharacterized membrane-anchored protein